MRLLWKFNGTWVFHDMPVYECSVEMVESLRLPGMYRVKTKCGDTSIEFEISEKIMRFNAGDKLKINVSTNRDECLENEFCGWGYVVSITKLEDKYRTVISLHGPLVIIYTENKPKSPLKTMNKVYIGISRT